MAAYLIADIEVRDQDMFDRYRKEVPETIARYGGRYLVRGGETTVKEGAWQPARIVVLEFPNMATLKRWYDSDDYQKILGLRTEATVSRVVLVEGV